MNCINLIGRLTADPELRYTASETPVASFCIAVDRRFKDKDGNRAADFINCVAWRKTGELIAQHFSKGKQIAVTGALQMRDYTDKDGNKRRTFEVNVENIDFCGSGKSEAKPQESSAGESWVTNDDDFPF